MAEFYRPLRRPIETSRGADPTKAALLGLAAFLFGAWVFARQDRDLLEEENGRLRVIVAHQVDQDRLRAIERLDAERLLTPMQRIELLRAEHGESPMPPWDPRQRE